MELSAQQEALSRILSGELHRSEVEHARHVRSLNQQVTSTTCGQRHDLVTTRMVRVGMT